MRASAFPVWTLVGLILLAMTIGAANAGGLQNDGYRFYGFVLAL